VSAAVQREIAIQLTCVRKTFGPRVAVNDVTLSIPKRSVFGLIGPNGAGKTTTFSMIAGYLLPSGGSVEVLGHPARSVRALRGRLGVLPQDAILPANERVGDFVSFLARLQGIPSRAAETEVRRVLEEVEGGAWWGLKCGALSHGMAKRVGIAQALLGSPEVVLLDEPTAGLDPRSAWEIRQLLKARRGTCAMVVSSHNLHELEEICDAAAILDLGRLVVAGPIHELTASSQQIAIELAEGPTPIEALRALPLVRGVTFEAETRTLLVDFDPATADAETVIAEVLGLLLAQRARISGVSKGRGLERRVMELTGAGA
jgi:ABC-type multidrug transport system ATPase subunit